MLVGTALQDLVAALDAKKRTNPWAVKRLRILEFDHMILDVCLMHKNDQLAVTLGFNKNYIVNMLTTAAQRYSSKYGYDEEVVSAELHAIRAHNGVGRLLKGAGRTETSEAPNNTIDGPSMDRRTSVNRSNSSYDTISASSDEEHSSDSLSELPQEVKYVGLDSEDEAELDSIGIRFHNRQAYQKYTPWFRAKVDTSHMTIRSNKTHDAANEAHLLAEYIGPIKRSILEENIVDSTETLIESLPVIRDLTLEHLKGVSAEHLHLHANNLIAVICHYTYAHIANYLKADQETIGLAVERAIDVFAATHYLPRGDVAKKLRAVRNAHVDRWEHRTTCVKCCFSDEPK